jgi:hypothetical protein
VDREALVDHQLEVDDADAVLRVMVDLLVPGAALYGDHHAPWGGNIFEWNRRRANVTFRVLQLGEHNRTEVASLGRGVREGVVDERL